MSGRVARSRLRRLLRSGALLTLLFLAVAVVRAGVWGAQRSSTPPRQTAAGAAATPTSTPAPTTTASPASAPPPTTSPSTTSRATASTSAASAATAPALGDGRAVTLAFGGDVHFEGVLADRLADDPATALGPVATLLRGAELSMVNLESAVTNGTCPQPQPKQYVFWTRPTAFVALRSAGVTLVTEANNHGEDCGPQGVAESLALEHAAHFPVIGIGHNAAQAFAPFRITIDGQRIAIIAATQVLDDNLKELWTATATQPGLASAHQVPELLAAVRAARRTADTVVVYLHWGTEGEDCPNALQPALAKQLVAAGADIVVGTHAHVQLGAGYLRDALVDYGLGNLAFYDTSEPEIFSGVLDVTVTGRRIDSYRWRPALISGGLPYPLAGAAAASADARWQGLRGCTDLSARPG